jgi:hypothetical protein
MSNFGNSLPFDVPTVASILATRLTQDEAIRRAEILVGDLNLAQRPIELHWLEVGQNERWPYYTFGKSAFGPERLDNYSSQAQKAIGYGLNWGDLITLSKVVKLARQIWNEKWISHFKKRMANFDDHIAYVEELWWLSLWHSPQKVVSERSPFPPCKKNVDWQFDTCTKRINLEVKYRPRDWMRHVDGELYATIVSSYFDEIAMKFPRRNADQLNLVAMTVIAPIDQEFRKKARQFLDETPTLDGIIFWSLGNRDTLTPQFQLQPQAVFLKEIIKNAEEEDRWRNPFVIHPWMDREKRRAKRLGIIEDFAKIDGVFKKVGKIYVPKSKTPQ